MRNCILCQKPTKGSVGAAGIEWKSICQPCKDEEDSIAAAQSKVVGELIKTLWS